MPPVPAGQRRSGMDKRNLEDQDMIQPDHRWVRNVVRQVLFAVSRAAHTPEQYVIAVFTGATAGLSQALTGLEPLMLNGMGLRVVLSESAGHLYKDVVKNKLLTWPVAEALESADWFNQVQNCSGVVVPMLSVATLSRVCSLAPDSLAANIILQSLFMGKTLVAAIDGAAPGSPDRKALGLDQGTRALQSALASRLVQLSDFGGRLCRAKDLGPVCRNVFFHSRKITKTIPGNQERNPVPSKNPVFVPPAPARLVDAGVVKNARRTGTIIEITSNAVITPLARELARGWGMTFRPDTKEPVYVAPGEILPSGGKEQS